MFGSIKKAFQSAGIKQAYEDTIRLQQIRMEEAISNRLEAAKRSSAGAAEFKLTDINEVERNALLRLIAQEAAISLSLHQLKADFARFRRDFAEQEE